MGKFLIAAYRILDEDKSPLSAIEITDKAIRKGYLITNGKTPHYTMKSKLSTDIIEHKDHSLFKRVGTGKFALREWDQTEYHAQRFKKALFDEQIVVINRNLLNYLVGGNGLVVDNNAEEVYNFIKRHYRLLKRRDAEEIEDVIQLVSAFLVSYENKYLTFKRSKRLPESRLHGFYSILFGGHVSPQDVMPLLKIFDSFRELGEELKLDYKPKIEFRGLLYDDSMPVSRLHLGIVYDVHLQSEIFRIGEKGFLVDPKFEDIDSIIGRIDDFENWSRIIIMEEKRET